jgi:hypothetical protein
LKQGLFLEFLQRIIDCNDWSFFVIEIFNVHNVKIILFSPDQKGFVYSILFEWFPFII